MNSQPTTSATGRWMALAAALLGWMFDGAEMGLFSMVGRSAIQDLLGFGPGAVSSAQEKEIGLLFGIVIAVFLVGAATGGVVFGWLGDRIGRVRAMSLSIITYALFTGLCGLVNDPLQLAVLRFIASLGMGGEWSLGVALVMEVWPNRSRALMAGLIGAAANVGYLLVGVIGMMQGLLIRQLESGLLAIGLPQSVTTSLTAFDGWRLLMILGALPALLTFFIRLFVPESQKWQHEKDRGVTSNWLTHDLLGVLIGALGPALIILCWTAAPLKLLSGMPEAQRGTAVLAVRLVGTLVGLVIATVGYTWPVVRFVRRSTSGTSAPVIRRMLLAACLSGVALLGTWGASQWVPSWAGKFEADEAARIAAQQSTPASGTTATAKLPPRMAKPYTQMALAFGAIVGTILAALAGDWFGRRITYCLLCILSLASSLFLFQANTGYGPMFLACAFTTGVFTAAFYGWLPLYLPELFGTSVRATCQGFSFNFGRILAAIGVLQAGALFELPSQVVLGRTIPAGHALAGSIVSLIYIIGIGLIWLMPETKGRPLPE